MKKSFRKAQRKINKEVKRFNQIMERDEAFLGRIYARQYSSGWHEYSDGSGNWYGCIRIYDKKTNTYKSVLGNEFNIVYGMHGLWIEANDFITMDLKIDIRRAIALSIDYRNVKHNPEQANPFYDYYDANYTYKY